MSSNAARLAAAVSAVAAEVERTGLDVCSIQGSDRYSDGLVMSVHARTPQDVGKLAALFPGLPNEPTPYGTSTTVHHTGEWVGMGFMVEVYGPAPVAVTA